MYFVRHGQSGNNARQEDDSVVFSKRLPDPHLTENGRLQANVAGVWLSESLQQLYNENQNHQHCLPEVILTSPMMRALETADCLSKMLPTLPVVVLRDLCEIGGLFAGPRTPTSTPREKANSPSSEKPPAQEISHGNELRPDPPNSVTGITLPELRTKFPAVRITQNIEKNGWWFRERETHEEAVHRAWKFTRLLWIYAASHPYSSLIVVTHGLFQDLILKTLICSTGPVAATRTPPTSNERLPFSGVHSFNRDAHLWPVFSLDCPIATCVSDDAFTSYTDFHLLCNNVGISLFELFVTEPRPSIPTLHSEDQDARPSEEENPVDELILKLGVLYWNQFSFLPSELRRHSGQVVNGFSVF